jgi:hypothetical protein
MKMTFDQQELFAILTTHVQEKLNVEKKKIKEVALRYNGAKRQYEAIVEVDTQGTGHPYR